MHKATIVTVISASAMTVISAGAGYYAAQKRLESKFENRLESEIASTKEFYAKLNKADEFSTPEDAVRTLHPEAAQKPKEPVVKMGVEAAEAMATYQGDKVRVLPSGVALMAPVEEESDSEEDDETLDSLEEKVLAKSGSQTLFEGEELNPDDFDIEAERDSRRNGVPYVVSVAEYDENPDNHEQVVLTYFIYDEVLVDEDEKEIDRIEETVGKANLRRFGHGSNDAKIVYIRNEARGMDFEVLRSDGSYAEEVLGLAQQDEDDRSLGQSSMRRRRSAEE